MKKYGKIDNFSLANLGNRIVSPCNFNEGENLLTDELCLCPFFTQVTPMCYPRVKKAKEKTDGTKLRHPNLFTSTVINKAN